jgi:hypothetical protein
MRMTTTMTMTTMGGGLLWTAVMDAAKVAADLILARRAWAVAVCNNNYDNDSREGNPHVPNDATAGGGGTTTTRRPQTTMQSEDASTC